jgi:hypothetical protein
MITTEGKLHIKRYLAGYVPKIAEAIVFGIGSQAEVLADTKLQLEVGRSAINLTSLDLVNNQLVYKAAIPDNFAGKIYEIGLYSRLDTPVSGGYGSRIITSFDSGTEKWVDPATSVLSTFAATSTRVGADSLSHTPALSATMTSALQNIYLDFSGNSAADGFTFAYNVGNANTNNIVFRFMTDTSNYYDFAMGVQTAGYKIVKVTKSTAVATGTPNWANITELRVLTTSKSSGASAVEFDAVRLEDNDSYYADYVLVARKVLVTPFTSIDGKSQDMEYTLGLSI